MTWTVNGTDTVVSATEHCRTLLQNDIMLNKCWKDTDGLNVDFLSTYIKACVEDIQVC